MLRAPPSPTLLRAAGTHRSLAGDRAGELDLRRGARHGCGLRPRLVARAGSEAAAAYASAGAAPAILDRVRAHVRPPGCARPCEAARLRPVLPNCVRRIGP